MAEVPIEQIEEEIRNRGMFLLVSIDGRKLGIFGYSHTKDLLQQVMDSLSGRRAEMIRFLTARARARGETR